MQMYFAVAVLAVRGIVLKPGKPRELTRLGAN